MKTPSNEMMQIFQNYQRVIKQSRKRAGTHIRMLCSELQAMCEEYPCLRPLLDDSVERTVRFLTR